MNLIGIHIICVLYNTRVTMSLKRSLVVLIDGSVV